MKAIHIRLSADDHKKAVKDAKKLRVSLNQLFTIAVKRIKILYDSNE